MGEHRRDVLLVCLGVALLVGSVFVGASSLTDTYRHDAQRVGGDGSTLADSAVLEAKDLTLSERAIVLEAVASPSAVWTADPVGLEFRYPGGTERAEYIVELDGVRYSLETSAVTRPVAMVVTGISVSLAFAGVLLLLAGATPLTHELQYPDTPPTELTQSLVERWLPTWAVLALAPGAVLVVVFPVVFETVVSLPLNLFLTPIVLASTLCAGVSLSILPRVSLPDIPLLGSAVNAPILWILAVVFAVDPSTGETHATLTLFLGLGSLPVVVGVVLAWYTLRWLEIRRSEYPHSPVYWRI